MKYKNVSIYDIAYLFGSFLFFFVQLGYFIYIITAEKNFILISFLYLLLFKLGEFLHELFDYTNTKFWFIMLFISSLLIISFLEIAFLFMSFFSLSLMKIRDILYLKSCKKFKIYGRVLGFLISPLWCRLLFFLSVLSFIVLLAYVLPKEKSKLHWYISRNTEKESSVSLKLLLGMSLMMVHHMHYFAYAYSMPILFMELNSKSYYLLGLFFYIGWAAYNLYEKRLKPKFLFFIFGHILSSIALFVLSQTTSFTVALVAWFVTGLGGGTIYMLPSLLSRNVVGIDHGLRIAEGIGHICGILLWGASLYFFNSLRLSFIAAAFLSLTVCVLSIFYSSRLEAQNGY